MYYIHINMHKCIYTYTILCIISLIYIYVFNRSWPIFFLNRQGFKAFQGFLFSDSKVKAEVSGPGVRSFRSMARLCGSGHHTEIVSQRGRAFSLISPHVGDTRRAGVPMDFHGYLQEGKLMTDEHPDQLMMQ